MPYLRSGLEVTVLFLAGLSLGVALQFAGLLPGNMARAVAARIWPRPAPVVLVPADPTSEPEVAMLWSDPLVRLVPRFPPLPPQPVGDDDPDRNALRREVIVAARRAVAGPCDLDRRAAFQIALRDYARAFANSTLTVRQRTDFRTPLDELTGRWIGLAHRSGLIDPELVLRWRLLERGGLDELLRRQNASMTDTTPEPCPSARHADAGAAPARL